MRARLQPTARDERRALSFAADLSFCQAPDELHEVALGLGDLIGADSVFLADEATAPPDGIGDLTVAGTTNEPQVYDDEVLGVVQSRWREQPVVVRQLRGMVDRPEMISDYLSPLEWRRRPLYQEAYRRMGMEHELSSHLAWRRGRIACASLHRRRTATEFGDRERTLAGLVTPHLRAARERVALIEAQRARIAALERLRAQHDASSLIEDGRVAATARLTPRQVEVAGLLVEGLSGPQIAERLQITPRTADSHIEHVYRRLGAHSRAQAVAILLGRTPPGGVSA